MTTKSIIVSAFSLALFASFSFKTTEPIQEYSLADAMAKKLITFIPKATGTYGASSVLLDIVSLTKDPIKVKVPAGTVFDAPEEGDQDFILMEELMVSLKPSLPHKQKVNGFCMNKSGSVPSLNTTFALKTESRKNLVALKTYMTGKKVGPSTMQDAVWVLTNNSSIANIDGQPAKVVGDLRDYLAKLTGQENPWHTAVQQTQVVNQQIVSTPVQITGSIDLLVKKDDVIYEEIVTSAGVVKEKTQTITTKRDSQLNYKFRIMVRGWASDKYKVNVYHNNKVVKSYNFDV